MQTLTELHNATYKGLMSYLHLIKVMSKLTWNLVEFKKKLLLFLHPIGLRILTGRILLYNTFYYVSLPFFTQNISFLAAIGPNAVATF